MRKPLTSTDRAVSDIIGFVLTFSIVLSAVGFVYIAGFGAIEDLRDQEDVNSGERVMRGVAETLEDIHRQSAPSRSLDVSIDRGNLDHRNSSVTVNVSGPSLDPAPKTIDVNALSLQPEGSETSHVYETGAVFRVQKQSALVRHQPVFSCSADAATLSLVKLDGELSISSPGSVELNNYLQETKLLYPNTKAGQSAEDFDNVSIDVSQTHSPAAWRTYFQTSAQNWEQGGDENVFYCDGVDRVFVRQTTIRVKVVN